MIKLIEEYAFMRPIEVTLKEGALVGDGGIVDIVEESLSNPQLPPARELLGYLSVCNLRELKLARYHAFSIKQADLCIKADAIESYKLLE
jgi:hypothetical protein